MEKKNKLYTTPSSGAVSQSQPAPFSGHYTDIPGQRPSQTRGAVRCGSIYFVFVGIRNWSAARRRHKRWDDRILSCLKMHPFHSQTSTLSWLTSASPSFKPACYHIRCCDQRAGSADLPTARRNPRPCRSSTGSCRPGVRIGLCIPALCWN